MKTTLYVYTGTGNSLAAAWILAEKICNTSIESIPLLLKKDGRVIPDGERVGLVFPVNYSGVPFLVSEFVSRLDLTKTVYTFALCTSGGIGNYTIFQLSYLMSRNGQVLHAGWMVPMVDNYIPYGGPRM